MIQNFSIDYNEVVSPSELYGVLDSETYYLVELDTSRKSLELPSIPDVGDLPEEISGGISALGDFYQSLLTASGFLPVFSILVIVVFFVRLLRR